MKQDKSECSKTGSIHKVLKTFMLTTWWLIWKMAVFYWKLLITWDMAQFNGTSTQISFTAESILSKTPTMLSTCVRINSA